MTIIKISDLTELTSAPADGDQLVIVDASEPADIDKTKRISVLNFLSTIVASIAAKVIIYRRQGGSATVWATAGTNNYTPTSPKIQTGSISMTVVNGDLEKYADVTFPVAYANKPMVFVSRDGTNGRDYTSYAQIQYMGYALSATTARIQVISYNNISVTPYTFTLYWMAIGE